MNVTLCRVLAAIYRAFCRVFRPVTVEGIERLPKDGAVIVYANHRNFRDPIILHAHLMRPMHFMGKKEIFKNRLIARALTLIGVFPVARGEADMNAIRTSLSILKNGGALGIFPEGHRYTDGEIHEAGNGTALIALRSGARAVPVRVFGGYGLFQKIRVHVGSPVDLSDIGARADSAALRAATARLMDALKALD